MKTKEITFDRFVRILGLIAALIGAYLLLRQISDVLIPFLVAWLIAYLLYPFVRFFQYTCRLRSRIVSIIVTIALFVGVIWGTIALITPSVTAEYNHVKDIVVHYVQTDRNVTTFAGEIETFLREHIDIDQFTSELTFSNVSQFLEEKVPSVMSFIGSGINALIGIVASFIAIIYLFFILLDYEKLTEGFFLLVPPSKRDLVRSVANDVKQGMNGYFRGQSLIALCVGILFAIGFLIIDFPLAIPLGLFIGMLNLVPYLQIVGFIPTAILALLQAHDTGQNFWSIMLSALIVFAVVQSIQDWVLTPRIMGKVTGLNAAIILLSLSVWGSLLGFIGLIIALPLTTLILSYYKRYVLEERGDEE